MNDLALQRNGDKKQGRDIAAPAEQAKAFAEMQAKILLAKQFPRQEERAMSVILGSVERKAFAECAYYSFPRGYKKEGNNWVKNMVEGPSVYLAREMARVWGNIWHSVVIVHVDNDYTTVEGRAWDLETNTQADAQATFKNLVQRKVKDPLTGKNVYEVVNGENKAKTEWVRPDEREMRELVNKHGAICVRNALLNLFPKDMIDAFQEKAKQTVVANTTKEDPVAMRVRILKEFESFGIQQGDLEGFLGLPIKNWDGETTATLRGVFTSLKAGQMSKSEIIGTEPMSKPPEKKDIADVVAGIENKKDDAPTRPQPTKKAEPQPAEVTGVDNRADLSKVMPPPPTEPDPPAPPSKKAAEKKAAMAPPDPPPPPARKQKGSEKYPEMVSQKQMKQIFAQAKDLKMSDPDRKALLKRLYGVDSLTMMTHVNADLFIGHLKGLLDEKNAPPEPEAPPSANANKSVVDQIVDLKASMPGLSDQLFHQLIRQFSNNTKESLDQLDPMERMAFLEKLTALSKTDVFKAG